MARRQTGSPTLDLTISEDDRERAIKSNSGACLIADAIKKQYPNLTKVTVDMATIRATDRSRGVRFTYLTPAPAQHLLLAFDQGWPNPTEQLRISRAVKVTPIIRSPKQHANANEKRAERIAELEAKQASGKDLTTHEKSVLTRLRLRQAKPGPERPSNRGRAKLAADGRVDGGQPLAQGKPHPNLLRGRNRHFGAKLADPGEAFHNAVEAEIAQRAAAQS